MIDDVEPMVERVSKVLAGHPPGLQGAVLADLLAIWLAGHVAPGDQARTDAVREELLQLHLATVRILIPVADANSTGEPRPWQTSK